jgi:hypothetical protein
MTFNDKKIPRYLVIMYTIGLSNIVMSCHRPIKCLGKKCESSVSINIPAAGASAEAAPQAPASPSNPAQDSVLREIKGLKDSAALRALVERVEAKLASLAANNMVPLHNLANDLVFFKQDLENKISEEQEKSQKLSVARLSEIQKNLAMLKDVSSELVAQKMDLLAGIEALESGILDPLVPEGIKTQLDFDALIIKMDVARSKSDLIQVEAIKAEMKTAVANLYVADKGLITSLIDQWSDLSVKMISAHAPDQVIDLLEKILDLESKIAVKSLTESAESLQTFRQKLDQYKKALVAPLKVLGDLAAEPLIKLETALQTSEKTIEAWGLFVSFVETTQPDIGQKVGTIHSQINQINEQMGNLKNSKIENEGNITFLIPSLTTLLGTLDKVQESIKKLEEGFKAAMAAQRARGVEGPDPKSLEAFKNGHRDLETLNGEILKAVGNLKNLVGSKSICSMGTPLSGLPFPAKEISCNGVKFSIIFQ